MNGSRFASALAGALLLTCVAPAVSGPAKPTVVKGGIEEMLLPAGSQLHFKKTGQDGAVYFDGPVEISGTYYYSENKTDDGVDRALFIKPDRASVARLPSFKDHGLADNIYLSNEQAFAKAAISPDKLAHLKQDGTHYISGKTDVIADQFQAGIECDVPNAQARFVSLAHAAMMASLAIPSDDEGC